MVQTSAKKRRGRRYRYEFQKLPPYVPLEEWLARPRTRVLRAMRFFPDGATASEIFDALELPTYDGSSNRERINHMTAIRNAVAAGELLVVDQHKRRGSQSNKPTTPIYRLKPGFDINTERPPQFREGAVP